MFLLFYCVLYNVENIFKSAGKNCYPWASYHRKIVLKMEKINTNIIFPNGHLTPESHRCSHFIELKWYSLILLNFQVVPVPELYLVSVKLSHDKTGAEHLHVARDDPNNVFW